jgi:hypothetical protein
MKRRRVVHPTQARRGTKGAWAQVRASSSRRLSLVVEVGIAAGGALKLKAISFEKSGIGKRFGLLL